MNPSYSPKEWGAVENGSVDDTAALQSWLNANQPHIGVPGTSVINQPLTCSNPLGYSNYNGVIRGPPPVGVSAGGQQPSFLITAGASFPNVANTAMLTMTVSPCAISGVGLIGSTSTSPSPLYDIVDSEASHNSVFNHSQLVGGNIGFNCIGAGFDIEIDDSSIVNSYGHGIKSYCSNMKILRNVISGAGSDAIHYGGSQVLIEANIIEQSGGNGIDCDAGAKQVDIVGNWFDDNGKGTPPGSPTSGGYNLYSKGCQILSITGNQFYRSDAYDAAAGNPTAQVWFDGANDTVSMAGNTNFAGNTSSVLAMRPDYDVELSSTGTVTNFSYADSPTPMNMGIFGPRAMAALGPFTTPNLQANYLSGLVTANFSSSSKKLVINPGTAADSTNIQLMSLGSSCTVDISTSGVGGLDTGSSNLHASTQYNFFVLQQGGYSSPVKCIASQGFAPNFYSADTNVGSAAPPFVTIYGFLTLGSPYIVGVTNSQCTVNGSGDITSCVNQNPFGGLAVGDYIADPMTSGGGSIPAGTQIAALNSLNVAPFKATTNGSQYVAIVGSPPATLYVGEQVGNCRINNPACVTAGGTFGTTMPDFAVIESITLTGMCGGTVSAPCFTMSANATGSQSSVYFTASGAFTITMSANASGNTVCCTSGPADTLNVFNDRYRMVAALYTDSSSNVETFTQDGDTFYLVTPVGNRTSTLGTSATAFPLGAVPSGIVVEALGRCVGGANRVLLFTLGVTPGVPNQFPVMPGFSVNSTLPNTAFPFRLHTDTSKNIYAQADGNPTTLNCMTDGWVWNRGK